jgi:hypothetical protein
MYSKFLLLISMSFLCVGYTVQAGTLECLLNDPKSGSANVSFSEVTHSVAVKSDSPEMNQYEGLQGRFDAELIDQQNSSPDLKDDTLIHFAFSKIGDASIRFFGDVAPGEVTVAEFIISEGTGTSSKISDFALECCVGKYPTVKNYAFSCGQN